MVNGESHFPNDTERSGSGGREVYLQRLAWMKEGEEMRLIRPEEYKKSVRFV